MSTGAKMRVYEIAREVGLPNKELLVKIRALGLEVNNHMSSLALSDVDRLKQSLQKDGASGGKTVTKKLSGGTVLRRRSKKKPEEEEAVAASTKETAVAPPVADEKEPAKAVAKRKPAADVAVEKPVEAPQVEETRAASEPAAEVDEDIQTPEPGAQTGPTGRRIDLSQASPKTGPVDILPEPEEAKAAPEPAAEAEEEPKDARSRFEAELQRARRQAEQKEKAKDSEQRKQIDEVVAEARDDGRPQVGSVISLPKPRIKIAERGPGGRQMPGQGQVRGRFAQQQNRGRRRNQKKPPRRGGGKATQITTPAEHKRVIRMEDTIAMPELAKGMGVKAAEVLKRIWGLGMTGININSLIDFETAQILVSEFGYEVQNVAFKVDDAFEQQEDSADDLETRAPVVTVMGHVDHGKTSLLDYIRKAKIAAGESGGITQHIGAYRVNDATAGGGDIVFIDTPGHAAFTEMRARGAQSTDIVILICAADDGVMPQTAEAVQHAKDAGVTIIVAVNKCDLPSANPEKARQQLAEHGLIPEEWGGDTIYVDVSAMTGDGVDDLLEAITINAELLELKANPSKPANGVVIEAKLDRSRGPMATVLVQEGTLRVGDTVVAGVHMGKVRAMLNENGESLTEAGPSVPVELLGLAGVPEAGEKLNATADEKMAKQVVEHRYQQKRRRELAATGKVSLEGLMEKIQEGKAEELKVVLKADVHGSAEALREALTKQSTDKVEVNVISFGVGGITESDVNLAKAGGAIIVGFHVRPAGKAAKIAEQEGVDIKIYDIIYEAIDDVRMAMAGLLAPIQREQSQGELEVRQTFTIPRKGVVAGCMCIRGRVERKSLIRVVRDSVQIYEGKVSSLRRFKDEVSEVKENYECGVMLDNFNDLKEGDILESYEIVEEKATL